MDVPAVARLLPVPRSGALREAVLRLAPRPDQERCSGRADQTLPAAEQDPARHPYPMVEDVPVGFLVLDQTPSAADPTADLLLRGLFVDATAQGRRVARRAVALLPGLVRERHAAARPVVLTVDLGNPAARAVSLSGCFVDEGRLHLAGDAGPQHVLRLDLPARDAVGTGAATAAGTTR